MFSDFGDFVLEHLNEAPYFPSGGDPCETPVSVEDVPVEGGGDMAGTVRFGLDENCCPIIESFTYLQTSPDLCDGPCWPFEVILDCPPCPDENPLP